MGAKALLDDGGERSHRWEAARRLLDAAIGEPDPERARELVEQAEAILRELRLPPNYPRR